LLQTIFKNKTELYFVLFIPAKPNSNIIQKQNYLF